MLTGSSTSVWAVLYQLMAGAVIMPIWLVLYLVGSGRSSYSPARNGRGSEVPAWCARWILPATLLGYVAPLLAMYVPWADVLNTSRAILVWQPAPIYINILLCLFPLLSPSPSPAGPTTTTAATAAGSTSHRQLKRAYAVLVALNAAAHLAVLYSVASAPAGSGVTWSTVFLPSRARRGEDFQGAWTWLFQVDLWGIYSTMLTWCAVEAYDLGGAAAALASAALTAAAGAALGPGAAMAAFWYWREDRIAALRATAAKVVGKKAA